MLDELREHIITFISQNRVCAISTRGSSGAWLVPAKYTCSGLEMDCLLPRWSDALYHLEQDPRVMLIVLDTQGEGLRWLQYSGSARVVASPDWEKILPERTSVKRPDERYAVIHLTPVRIDLIDESRGWGARETLDL